ncbi:endolytic transglycosylase MltG [Eionea flava]
MSKIMSFVSGTIVIAMLVMVIGTIGVNRWLSTPVNINEDTLITVKKGDTLSQLARELESRHIIPSAKLLVVYARLTQQTTINVGEYILPVGSNHQSLLALLRSDDVIRYSVTLVEGKTFDDFIRVLQSNNDLIHMLDIESDYADLLSQLAIDVEHPEGWFFPDTYQFVSGMSDVDILQQAHKKMQRVLEEEWQKKSANLPYNNAYEALIMASIIEKETGVPYERPEIAGVFVRRLNKGMRLQTDPTIIYGLGREYQGNIRRKHLRQKTPYNTYVIDGLPPTPIAMPGREAIHAALHPKAGNTLFFVAKGDGSHQFSQTLAQHNRAVRKYQIEQRREQYQSAPSQ